MEKTESIYIIIQIGIILPDNRLVILIEAQGELRHLAACGLIGVMNGNLLADICRHLLEILDVVIHRLRGETFVLDDILHMLQLSERTLVLVGRRMHRTGRSGSRC